MRDTELMNVDFQGVLMKTTFAFTSLVLVGMMTGASPARAQQTKDIVGARREDGHRRGQRRHSRR
jgi:hypothetical protein